MERKCNLELDVAVPCQVARERLEGWSCPLRSCKRIRVIKKGSYALTCWQFGIGCSQCGMLRAEQGQQPCGLEVRQLRELGEQALFGQPLANAAFDKLRAADGHAQCEKNHAQAMVCLTTQQAASPPDKPIGSSNLTCLAGTRPCRLNNHSCSAMPARSSSSRRIARARLGAARRPPLLRRRFDQRSPGGLFGRSVRVHFGQSCSRQH